MFSAARTCAAGRFTKAERAPLCGFEKCEVVEATWTEKGAVIVDPPLAVSAQRRVE